MYKKKQIGWPVIWTTFPVIAVLIGVGLFAVPRDQQAVFLIAPGVMLIVLLLFRDMTVSVDEERISIKYGTGLVKKNIPLADVSDCKKVRNKWWMGWGIRIGPGFTLYNISGLDAVELTLKDKTRKIRIGTEEPDELCAAIALRIKN
ncbi:MAG TPA: hypothetical protein VI112_13360 [Bacteroidia bacterium]|jgi:hypothetical protein